MNFRHLSFVAGLLFITQATPAATVLFEDFSAGLPNAWSYLNIGRTYTSPWAMEDGILSGIEHYYPIVTPSLDLSKESSYSAIIKAKSFNFASGEIQLFYQNQAGGEWKAISPVGTTSSFSNLVINLPNPSATYRVAFHASAVLIDEITITGSNAPFVAKMTLGITNETSAIISHPSGTNSSGSIEIAVPYAQARTALTPSFSGNFTSYSPTGSQNFTNPIVYTFSGTGGPSKYLVSVTNQPASSKAILSELHMATYGINYITEGVVTQPNGTGKIGRVDVAMPYGVSLDGLKIVGLSLSQGATRTYSPNASNGFDCTNTSKPCLTISVTSENSQVTQSYEVYVTNKPQGTQAEIQSIQLCYDDSGLPTCVYGVINQSTINFVIPAGIAKNSLEISNVVTSSGATYSPSGIQNFTNPLTLTVTSEDGKTKKIYTLAAVESILSSSVALYDVYVQDVNLKYGYAFILGSLHSSLSNIIEPKTPKDTGTVELSLPFGYESENVIEFSANGNSGATFTASPDFSNDSPINIKTTPLHFIGTSEDGKTKHVYKVHPNFLTSASTETGIQFLSIGQIGEPYNSPNLYTIYSSQISPPYNYNISSGTYTPATATAQGTFAFTVPNGEPLSGLKFASIAMNNLEETYEFNPSTAEFDFSNPSQKRTLTITAGDKKTKREYLITATNAPSKIARIESITLCDNNQICGTANTGYSISEPTTPKDTGTVYVSMGASANLNQITLESIRVSPYATFTVSSFGLYLDFSNDKNNNIIANVYAEDGVTKNVYTVKAKAEYILQPMSSSLKSSSSQNGSSNSSSSSTTARLSSSSQKSVNDLHKPQEYMGYQLQIHSNWLEVSFKKPANIQLELFNIVGISVRTSRGHGLATRMDLSDLSSGIYLLKVIDLENSQEETHRVIIRHSFSN